MSQATTGDLHSLIREPADFEDHINSILDEFTEKFRAKYTKGQLEHGGRLWKKNTDNFLLEETLDFISYTFTRKYQIALAIELLQDAIYKSDWREVYAALNVLEHGNPEGEEEEEK